MIRKNISLIERGFFINVFQNNMLNGFVIVLQYTLLINNYFIFWLFFFLFKRTKTMIICDIFIYFDSIHLTVW